MPAVIVVPVGNSFQHPALAAGFGNDFAGLAQHFEALDDAGFAAVTPAEHFHSWPSLKAAVGSEKLPCRFLLVATEQTGALPHDQERNSKPLLPAVARFIWREFNVDSERPHVVIHPRHSLQDLVICLEQYRAVWSQATAVYILGGSTRHVQEALATAVPAMVHGGCPVMRPIADRESFSRWEALSAIAADRVPVVALRLRALERNLVHLAEAILREPGAAALRPNERKEFETAMLTPQGSTERVALIEAWSRPVVE